MLGQFIDIPRSGPPWGHVRVVCMEGVVYTVGRVSRVFILGSFRKLVSCLISGIGARGNKNSWK